MQNVTLRRWDFAEHLKTEADMADYLNACLEEAGDDPAFIAQALGVIARARGMTQVAKNASLYRESLCREIPGVFLSRAVCLARLGIDPLLNARNVSKGSCRNARSGSFAARCYNWVNHSNYRD